jgi:hypothetical protein
MSVGELATRGVLSRLGGTVGGTVKSSHRNIEGTHFVFSSDLQSVCFEHLLLLHVFSAAFSCGII